MWGPILAWVRKQIGQRTDTASATGSVHAKLNQIVAAGVVLEEMVASNNLKISANTSRTKMNNSGGTYQLVKEIAVSRLGTVRAAFSAVRVNYTGSTYACIFVNGVQVGTERTIFNLTTYTEDIPVVFGDKIEVYTKGTSTDNGVTISDFRLYWDIATTTAAGGVVLVD